MYDRPVSLVGQHIDQYRLDRFLGGGAAGMVFKALDTVLMRIVAIRLIPKGRIADATHEESPIHQDAYRPFLQHAEAAALLCHPQIAALYGCGETAEFVYLCMEFASGRTLRKMLDERYALPVAEALLIFDQVLQAVALAGREGMVHGHIRPSSIMLADDSRVKVMDYGGFELPSRHWPTLETDEDLLRYRSPEQLSGQVVDIRSDIFSVGAVLFEAVTGAPPFTAVDPAALRHRILEAEPIPPRVLNIHVPELLENLIKKALAKRPSDRFQTPAAMRMVLSAVSPASAGPEGDGRASESVGETRLSSKTFPVTGLAKELPAWGGDGAKHDERHKAAVDAEDDSLVILLDTLAGDEPESHSPSRVVRAFRAVTVLLLLVVGGVGLWRLSATPGGQTASMIGAAVRSFANNGGDNPVDDERRSSVEALVEQAGILWESNPETAQKLLEQAVALDPRNFDANFQLARFLTFKKDFPAAIQYYQNALQINNQAPDIFYNLGYCYLGQGALDQAIENYEACRVLSPPYLDEVLINLAICQWKKSDPERARMLLQQALVSNPGNELARIYLNMLEKSVGSRK